MAKSMREEMFIIFVFFAREESFGNVVQGWLGQNNIRGRAPLHAIREFVRFVFVVAVVKF